MPSPRDLIAVGGTASNLLRLLPATAIDRVLTRRRIAVALAMLTVERSIDAAERHALRPQRARILPAGAVIVDAILERYGVDRLQVSEEGIREGAVLAAAAAGAAWRDRLRSWSRAGTRSRPRRRVSAARAGQSPATSLPSARLKARLDTPRHGVPTVRRSLARLRSRSTR